MDMMKNKKKYNENDASSFLTVEFFKDNINYF